MEQQLESPAGTIKSRGRMASVKRFLMATVGSSSARGSEVEAPPARAAAETKEQRRSGEAALPNIQEAINPGGRKENPRPALGVEIRTTTSPVEVTGWSPWGTGVTASWIEPQGSKKQHRLQLPMETSGLFSFCVNLDKTNILVDNRWTPMLH